MLDNSLVKSYRQSINENLDFLVMKNLEELPALCSKLRQALVEAEQEERKLPDFPTELSDTDKIIMHLTTDLWNPRLGLQTTPKVLFVDPVTNEKYAHDSADDDTPISDEDAAHFKSLLKICIEERIIELANITCEQKQKYANQKITVKEFNRIKKLVRKIDFCDDEDFEKKLEIEVELKPLLVNKIKEFFQEYFDKITTNDFFNLLSFTEVFRLYQYRHSGVKLLDWQGFSLTDLQQLTMNFTLFSYGLAHQESIKTLSRLGCKPLALLYGEPLKRDLFCDHVSMAIKANFFLAVCSPQHTVDKGADPPSTIAFRLILVVSSKAIIVAAGSLK